MIRLAICDDDELIRHQLFNIISDYLEKRNIDTEILTFSSGNEFFSKVKELDISCAFMDIDLKEEQSGIDIVKNLRMCQKTMMIIFVTSYPQFINKVLPLHTFDYITKPYKNSDIYKTLDDLFIFIKENNGIKKVKMQFKAIHGIVSLNVEDILYFEYKNRRIDIITKNSDYHMYGKMRSIYEQMKKYDFAVPHISYVVNLNEVKALIKSEYRIMMTNDQSIPISQLKLKEFKSTYLQFLKKYAEEK